MLYENKIETVPRELKALKAVYDPMMWTLARGDWKSGLPQSALQCSVPRLISDNRDVKIADTMMALTGMFQAGGTLSSQCDPGKPVKYRI
jgi:hypothetical protein